MSPLIDALAPQALGFDPSRLRLGEAHAAALVVRDYPPRVGIAWLARVASLPGVILSLHARPTDPGEMVKGLNRAISEFAARAAAGGNALMIQRAEQSLRDAQELLRKIDAEQQAVLGVSVVLLVLAPDDEELARRVRQVEAACAAAGMRARAATFLQSEGLAAAGPFASLTTELEAASRRDMPIETVAAAYPFVRSGINHGRGVVLGRDADGGLVLFDRWSPPDPSITNPNQTILAASGAGKSFSTKLWLLREWALGARVLVLDPEREYKSLCREMDGQWLNAAGGGARLNPLQPFGFLEPEEEGEEGAAMARSPVAQHMSRLRTWLRLYVGGALDDVEAGRVEDAVLDLYRGRGIDLDTDPRTVEPTRWPTTADLYRLLRERADHDPDRYERLAVLLRPAGEGADAALWAGPTTLRAGPEDDFVVIDIHELAQADQRVQRAQYYLLLGWAWSRVQDARATGHRTVLAVDEAWLLADENAPEALRFLRECAKRVRKYGASVWVVTQNVADLLAPAVAREGEAIIGNAACRVLLRQEARDLEKLAALYRLTEAEQDLLAGAHRGEGLLMAGNQRLRLRVEAAPHELALIAGGGGP